MSAILKMDGGSVSIKKSKVLLSLIALVFQFSLTVEVAGG